MRHKYLIQTIKLCILAILPMSLFFNAEASSHREAPLISNDPLADNVDVYAFRSPDAPGMVTLIATYVPIQLPHGGPNYYQFGENIRYEIHVDNDASVPGDEVTYRFTFTKMNEDPTTFFNIRLGQQNLKTTYTLEKSTDGGQTFTTIIENGVVPPNNIGPRSIESQVGLNTTYEQLMNDAITTASSGERVFCGPTDDPFFVDLGGIFDLGDSPRQNGEPRDGLACLNVSTIAIQVPIGDLLKDGAPSEPTSILDPDYVIGVWASASRPRVRTLTPGGVEYSGEWRQVSRLGMPLTNEAVIPIGQKDYWNIITPYDEINDTILDPFFYNPELALYMDDDQFGAAVPAFAPLRVQTNSLGAFDFSNGADGLFGLKGSDAVAGTALDDAVFGTLLLPGPGQPRSVDLWPAFHTGVPNVVPYQLATGKEGNPLAEGKPFVNNFLPNGGDMLRLNMAVPPTPRDDEDFSSLGLVQAAVLGLTDPRFNGSADLEFIPNMDGFPNGRRLEDDVTRIELQAVAGVVLAAVGLWYDDFNPEMDDSPVTQDLLDVLTYTTGVEANDTTFKASFPYVQTPWSGTGKCSGEIVDEDDVMMEDSTVAQFFVSSNTQAVVGVFNIKDDNSIMVDTFGSAAMDADGIYYDNEADVLYQLNRTDNVINAYSNVNANLNMGMEPELTATSTSDFSNGREIAVSGNRLVVAQDAAESNGNQNRLLVYQISPTSITLQNTYDVDINLWGVHAEGETLYAIVDNSDELAVFENFFGQADGMITPDDVITVEGIVRTHGLTYVADRDMMLLTDVGDGGSPDDGAFTVVRSFMNASADGTIDASEQIRIEGDATFLGNPVDIAFDGEGTIYIAERANGGGRVLGFQIPAPGSDGGNVAPMYNELFAGASAIYFDADFSVMLERLAQFFVSSNTQPVVGVYNILEDNSIMMNSFTSEAMDADGIYYVREDDVLYQLNRTDNVINAYSNVNANLDMGMMPELTATSTSDFSNGREIAVSGNRLVVAQDAAESNGNQNRLLVYQISPTSITLQNTYDVDINLWGVHAEGETLYAIVDNSDELAVFENFFGQADGMITPDDVITVEGIVRTHGLTYIANRDMMLLTDVGDGGSPDDGAFTVVRSFMMASSDGTIDASEQIRIEGDATFLGNPVDIAFDGEGTVYIAERANGGGRVLGFDLPAPGSDGGNVAPIYNTSFAGASAIYFDADQVVTSDGVDLELDITASIDSYDIYVPIPYTITITNNGSQTATGVTVSVPFPDSLVFTSSMASQGMYNTFFKEWTVGTLESGASATLNLTLFPLIQNDPVTAYAEVSAADQQDADSTPGNGDGMTANEDDEATLTLPPANPEPMGGVTADLEVAIDVDSEMYMIYQNYTYTITLTNNGPDAAANVFVSAPFPDGMVHTSNAPSVGKYNLFFQRWEVPQIESGATATLELVLFTLVDGQPLVNFVEVSASDQDDPDSTPDNGDGMTPAEDDEAVATITPANANNNNQLVVAGATGVTIGKLYPVPTRNQLFMSLESELNQSVTVTVMNTTGQVALQQQIELNKGLNNLELNVSDLPAGGYYISIPVVNEQPLQKQFLIAR